MAAVEEVAVEEEGAVEEGAVEEGGVEEGAVEEGGRGCFSPPSSSSCSPSSRSLNGP